jgi:hypothetical protein
MEIQLLRGILNNLTDILFVFILLATTAGAIILIRGVVGLFEKPSGKYHKEKYLKEETFTCNTSTWSCSVEGVEWYVPESTTKDKEPPVKELKLRSRFELLKDDENDRNDNNGKS